LSAWHTSTALELVGVERAVGLKGQVVVADGGAALQRQRLGKMHGLGVAMNDIKKPGIAKNEAGRVMRTVFS
jgi:hypothetical protein